MTGIAYVHEILC